MLMHFAGGGAYNNAKSSDRRRAKGARGALLSMQEQKMREVIFVSDTAQAMEEWAVGIE